MSLEFSLSQILLLSCAELLLLGLWFSVRRRRLAEPMKRPQARPQIRPPVVPDASDDPAEWFVLDLKTRQLFEKVMAGADGFEPPRPRRRVALGTQGHPDVLEIPSTAQTSAPVAAISSVARVSQ